MPFSQTEAEAKADFETYNDVTGNQNIKTLNSSRIQNTDQSSSNTNVYITSGQVQLDLSQFLRSHEKAFAVPRQLTPSVTGVKESTWFRSALLGYTDTDVGMFDDVAQVRKQWDFLAITKILQIKIQQGRWVHYIAVTYKLSNGAKFRTDHGVLWPSEAGPNGSETIDISDSEQVVGISGRASSYMVHELAFHIQDHRNGEIRIAGPFGNERSSPKFRVEEYGAFFHCKGDVVAFAGTLGNLGDNEMPLGGLSFICRDSPPELEAEDGSSSLFQGTLQGCTDTDFGTFDDIVYVATESGLSETPKISALTIQHGPGVHHLAVTYKLSNGGTCRTANGDLYPHFANETIDLSDSEQIVAISGRASSFLVHEMEFHIQNTRNGAVRTVGPFGNGRAVHDTAVEENGDFFHCKGNIVSFAGTLAFNVADQKAIVCGLAFITQGSPPEISFN